MHPNGKYTYLINELDATVVAYAFDPAAGGLRALESYLALPEGYTGHKQAADIHVEPSGRFLYASNRGHDSFACFAIDEEDGHLTYQDHILCGGREPRGFAIDPTGTFLLAANQNSNNIVTFLIDPARGQLSRTGEEVEVSMPVCIKFA